MKILVVTNLYPTAERPARGMFVKEQVESLRHEFPDLAIGVRVIKGDRPRWAYLREMLLLPAVVKKGGYDIVHAHFGLSLVSVLFVRAPVVVTFHGSDLLVKPTSHLSRLLVPKASRVIVVAQRLRESLGYGEVIPCGIPVKDFELPARFGNKPSLRLPGDIKVLFPSDPATRVKGYALFERVCEELEKRGNHVERIHLVNIDRAKVPGIYWDCDLMLLTSLSEGSPTVIKEAIAARLPFVSVDVGDVREWARHVEFGVVVPDRDPKNMADAAAALLAQIKNRPSLDISVPLKAMNTSNIARRIRDIYNELLAERLEPISNTARVNEHARD